MSTPDPGLRRATAFVVAAIVCLPLTVAVVAALPTGRRPLVFLAGIALMSALSLRGGLRARRALLANAPGQVRAAVIAGLGLLLGVTTSVFCVWSAFGALVT